MLRLFRPARYHIGHNSPLKNESCQTGITPKHKTRLTSGLSISNNEALNQLAGHSQPQIDPHSSIKYDIIPMVAKRKALPRNSVIRKIRILAKPVSTNTSPTPIIASLINSTGKAAATEDSSPLPEIPQGKKDEIPNVANSKSFIILAHSIRARCLP